MTVNYKDSGVESEFSQTLLNSIFNNFGSESALSTIVENPTATESVNCIFELYGNYQQSETELIISVNILDSKSGDLVASKEKTISKSVLVVNSIT